MNKHMENKSAKRGGEETGKHENRSDANGSSVDTESITTSSGKPAPQAKRDNPPSKNKQERWGTPPGKKLAREKRGQSNPLYLVKHNFDHDHEYLRKDCHFKEKR